MNYSYSNSELMMVEIVFGFEAFVITFAVAEMNAEGFEIADDVLNYYIDTW